VLLTVVDYCLLECDAVFNLAEAYQKFRRSILPVSYLSYLKMEATDFSEILIKIRLHGVIFKVTAIFLVTSYVTYQELVG
jgi:hypothetical protein